MKTCIIYASTHGSTEMCAKELGNLLQAETINIHDVKTISIAEFDCIILGSSIYVGQINKALKSWVNQHESMLLSKTLGLFVCCGVDEQKSTYFTNNFSSSLLKHATAMESFGGIIDESKMTWAQRMITKMVEKSQKEKREVVLLENRIQEFATQIINRATLCSLNNDSAQ